MGSTVFSQGLEIPQIWDRMFETYFLNPIQGDLTNCFKQLWQEF
jgi:hypothetical protein